MNTIPHTAAFSQYAAPGIGTRAVVFALVIAGHAAVWSVWNRQSDTNIGMQHEMSVSFALAAQVPQVSLKRQQQVAPAPTPVTEQVAQPAAVAEPVTAVAAPAAAPAAPEVVTTEPDYKAAYLNNPPPAYPLAARRMGLQGRVLLNVEVLANGICGHIRIEKSSGYAMLDNAALETVKTWRFLPARQAGTSVDKWFMIPVQFSLRDNAA